MHCVRIFKIYIDLFQAPEVLRVVPHRSLFPCVPSHSVTALQSEVQALRQQLANEVRMREKQEAVLFKYQKRWQDLQNAAKKKRQLTTVVAPSSRMRPPVLTPQHSGGKPGLR